MPPPVRQMPLPPSALLGAGMRLFVHLFHPLRTDVGVDLRGAEILMTEHLLHAPQIRPRIQQVRRK